MVGMLLQIVDHIVNTRSMIQAFVWPLPMFWCIHRHTKQIHLDLTICISKHRSRKTPVLKTTKANQNISQKQKPVREFKDNKKKGSYQVLMRPKLNYCSTVADLSKDRIHSLVRVFSHVTLQLRKPRLTGNFFIECMIISDFTFVNKCLYMYYISINLSLNKLLNDI